MPALQNMHYYWTVIIMFIFQVYSRFKNLLASSYLFGVRQV